TATTSASTASRATASCRSFSQRTRRRPSTAPTNGCRSRTAVAVSAVWSPCCARCPPDTSNDVLSAKFPLQFAGALALRQTSHSFRRGTVLRVGVGLSAERDSERAASEAAEMALQSAGLTKADAVLVFATTPHGPGFTRVKIGRASCRERGAIGEEGER